MNESEKRDVQEYGITIGKACAVFQQNRDNTGRGFQT